MEHSNFQQTNGDHVFDYEHISAVENPMSKPCGSTEKENCFASTDNFCSPASSGKDSWDANNNDNSLNSKAQENALGTDFDLDEDTMLSLLSVEDKYGNVPFTDAVNLTGMEIMGDNLDTVLNNTLSMIFEHEKNDASQCASNQDENGNHENVPLQTDICMSSPTSKIKQGFYGHCKQIEENASTMESIYSIIDYDISDTFPKDQQHDTIKEEFDLDKHSKEIFKESLNISSFHDDRDILSDLQSIVTKEMCNQAMELVSSGHSNHEFEGLVVSTASEKIDFKVLESKTEYNKKCIDEQGCLNQEAKGNSEPRLFSKNSKPFFYSSKADSILGDGMAVSTFVLSDHLYEGVYKRPAFSAISPNPEVSASSVSQKNKHLSEVGEIGPSDIQPQNNQQSVNSLEIKNHLTSANASVSGKNNFNSDVVWTMQMPKSSVSPFHLNNSWIRMPGATIDNDLYLSKRPEHTGNVQEEKYGERNCLQQESKVLRPVCEEDTVDDHLWKLNALIGFDSLSPEILNETRLKCNKMINDIKALNTGENHSGTAMPTFNEDLSFSLHPENLSCGDLVGVNSVFENTTLDQVVASNGELTCQTQGMDNSQSPGEVTVPSHLTQPIFECKLEKSDEMEKASAYDDMNTLLDSFMHEVDSKHSAQDIQLDSFKSNDNFDQGNYMSNSVTPAYTQVDHTLDDFLSEFNTDYKVPSSYNGTSVEKQHQLDSNFPVKNSTLVTSSPKKKTLKPTIFQVHSANQNSSKYYAKGRRIKRKVSFKTRPAGKPIKCVVRGQVVENVLQKRPRTLRFVLDKERRLENQDGTSLWPQREDFNPNEFCHSQNRDAQASASKFQAEYCNHPQDAGMKRQVMDIYSKGSFILPVGETGLSITIPTNATTNITSFLPSTSTGNVTKLTPILPCQKNETCFAKLIPAAMPKPPVSIMLSSMSEKGNGMGQPQNVLQMVNQTQGSLLKEKSMLQTSLNPVSSVAPIYVVVPTVSAPKTKNTYSMPSSMTTVVSGPLLSQGSLGGSKWQHAIGNKQSATWGSRVLPIAPNVSQNNASQCMPVKNPSIYSTSNIADPVKIFVNTKSKPLLNETLTLKSSCEEVRKGEKCMDEPRFRSEIVQSLQQNILKRKMHPETSIKKYSRVLKDELRVRFPDIPETILSKLSIPPQAMHRGYFSMLDLQTLRTQALALRLRTVFREHVSQCIVHNCVVCINFLKERQKLSWVEKEKQVAPRILKKSRNVSVAGRCKSRGRGRRGSRVRGNRIGEKDDPTYEPPHSYTSSKKKKPDDQKEASDTNVPLKMCTNDCHNTAAAHKRFRRIKILHHNSNLRECYSETNLYALTKSHNLTETCNYDDLNLTCHNASYLKCLLNVQSIRTHLASQDGRKRMVELNVMSVKSLHDYDQQDRKLQQVEMLKEALFDLSVRRQIEKSFCIPFCEGDVRRSKGSSPKPLYYDIHSLNIGPLKVLAKYEREFLPKLRVIFTARKFTYEYELMCGMSKNHEPDPCKVRSVSGGPRPQLLITIDIPFKTIQAMAIHSNKVSLLVKTIPYIQVVARRGLSRVVVPERTALSLAQKKYFANVKAVLSIFPLHQLLLADHGRAASLRNGLCGFATWFKTFLVHHLPIPQFHIPSWCLTPHLDPDSLAQKLSQHATQGYVEATKRSTCIIRDSVSGKFFGKVVESDKPNLHQVNGYASKFSVNQAYDRKPNPGFNFPQFHRLEPMKIIRKEDCPKYANVNVPVMNAASTNSKTIEETTKNTVSSENKKMHANIVQYRSPSSNKISAIEKLEANKNHSDAIVKKPTENFQPDEGSKSQKTKEESAAQYLLSAVRSALDSKRVTGSQPYTASLPFPPLYNEKGCACKGLCRQMECPCARGGVLCGGGQTCSCESCDNPLNVLHILNLDIHTARVDECLMQNLYSLTMPELCKVLVSLMVLPCCGNTTELRHLIPGTMLCNWCGTALVYSWCSRYVHLQTLYPRNHCLACCSCKPTLHTHCQVCHHCTPSTGQGTCCKCGTPKPFGV